jgi:nucleotide-binding universal stress UspA family protein
MNVVLGVDGSPSAMKAVEWVVTSSEAVGRVLVISAAHAGMAMADSMLVKLEREAAEGHVREATRALAGLGSKVAGRVVDGDPRQVLVDTALTENADLLVVGCRGRTGVERLLLGSVASHVAVHAPCSVLIVRDRLERSASGS